MTKAIHSRFLKDENGAISDHLRSHVHLTNCIHLRNHMHRNSPILAERSLIRDLVVLQRSRSLRDPSTSPPSWHSTSVIDTLAKKLEKDGTIHCGRRSVGERRRDVRRISDTSSPFGALATSKVAAAEVIRENDAVASVSGRSSVGRHRVTKRNKGEGSSKKNQRGDLSGIKTVQDSQGVGEGNDLVSRRADQQDKEILQKRVHGHNVYVKTLSEQLRELPADSEDAECSRFHSHGRHAHEDKARREPEGFVRNYCNGLNRVKKRKVGGTRRSRLSVGSRDMGLHNEISVASNSLAQNSRRLSYYKEGEEGDAEFGVTQAPRNGCGIPWNWSRIHHRGKTFLDMAGRSLSCGLSDSRLRKTQGNLPENQRIVSDLPMGSDHSGSSQRSESEELPLLVEPSGSQESTENAIWTPRDYLGELGIFAKHNVKHGLDSDIASEVRSGGRHNYQRCRHGRHQSLTQKYMPRTFKDLVGQNLAVQALSNAVIRRKVGLLYVFHGPHGTGKTSCARIFARALNCQSIDHTKPCGTCSSCSAHELGKSRNVRELGGIGNFDFETLMDLVENMAASQLPSQYRVFIVDECDTLPLDSWSAISKVIDLAPRKVVFVLVSTTFDHFPHIIISRCQKFFFPKLKDADIIYALQWIATKESLDIDKDALKLIASRADGSLRDAEMTLDQLSLLAQKISVPLVQELVGLISDDKLVDLLDLALSADTVNTVKNLREIMEAGVEPLALMSQLATIITDILAGSYTFTREKLRRKFFRRSTLSKDDMERLRQALKTLSEAEKQLRLSNDRLTWLTAALLQLAPDQQYVLPSSSAETSFNSPAVTNNPSKKKTSTKWTSEQPGMYNNGDGLPTSIREENLKNESANFINSYMGGKRHVGVTPPRTSTDTRGSRGNIPGKGNKEIEEIWLAVIENIQINILKQLMLQEGKLMSLSLGAAPTAQLMFSSLVTKSKAEKFRGHILQAFECTLGSPVTIEIRCESSRKDQRASDNGSAQFITSLESLAQSHDSFPKSGSENHMRNLLQDKTAKGATSGQARRMHSDSLEISKNEIVEIGASKEHEGTEHTDGISQLEEKGMERVWVQEETSSRCQSISGSHPERRKIGEQSQRQSIVRSKVSLAHVIQQAEGRTQGSRWSRRKAVSIAEKLEQENLRLEPRSRNLLCWKASKVPRAKLPHLKNRTKGARSLMKLVSCSKCLCAKSPR